MITTHITYSRGGVVPSELADVIIEAVDIFSRELKIHRLNLTINIFLYKKQYINREQHEGATLYIDRRECNVDIALYGDWLGTLAHEITHVKQFVRGELCPHGTKWKGRLLDHRNTEYIDLPHEKEAFLMQKVLVRKYLLEKGFPGKHL